MTDEKVTTYERQDRGDIETAVGSMMQVYTLIEAMLLQEKYGLTTEFDYENLEWHARDPRDIYSGKGPTPAAAIYLWELKRAKAEGNGDASD